MLGATIMARLGEVHFAVKDPKMGCLGGATELHLLPFSNHRPKIYSGTMELECKEMLQAFSKCKENSRQPSSKFLSGLTFSWEKVVMRIFKVLLFNCHTPYLLWNTLRCSRTSL